MNQASDLFLSWVMGALSGFVASIPVGPINITIVNEGVRRGFWWSFWIGLGAVVMEMIYCTMAFAGFSGLFASEMLRAAIELTSFLLMLVLGIKYLLTRSLPAMTKTVERVEHRLHPHTAFMTGFVRVLANPGVLLFWITIAATFIAHEWMNNTWTSKAACVFGVGTGVLLWFVSLSFGVSLGHGKISERSLIHMAQVSGALLLIAAIFIGARLVSLIAKNQEIRAKVKTLEQQIQRPFK